MINDDTIYFLELKQDVLFRKINRNDYMYYIENCKSFARKIYDIYKNENIVDIIEKHGFKILKIYDNVSKNSPYILYSEIVYFDNKKEINIYVNDLNKKLELISKNIKNIDLNFLINLCIAHEFYHFLEIKYDIYVQKYLKKIKGIFFESKLNACSEICAIEFSRLFTNSEINPKYIDYLALIKKGYIDYTYLEEAENELYNICK
jgi:hypothetical protein